MAAMNSGDTTLFVCVTCRAQAADGAQSERPGARLLAAINATLRSSPSGKSVSSS